MKSFLLLFLPTLVLGDSSHSNEVLRHMREGHSREKWVTWQKKKDPEEFAKRYGFIEPEDGIDQKEAWAIAKFYFYSTGNLCGMAREPIKEGELWKSELLYGIAGTPIAPILVDAKTGAVWQTGGERIDDVMALLDFESPQHPQSSESN